MLFALLLSVLTFPSCPASSSYHTTSGLLSSLRSLAHTCPYATLHHGHAHGLDSAIPILTLSCGQCNTTTVRLLLTFGEHGRERITSELALHLARYTCAHPAVLGVATVVLVPLVNAYSRRRAERWDGCARTNAAGVDLNRNYGYRWGERESGSVAEEAPGRGAFSEGETRVVAAVARRVRPDVYISVHSGAEAVLVPWDSGGNVGGRVLEMGREVGRRHCGGCAVGNAGEVFGYRAFGTGVDYMYGVVGVGVVMTVEIYGRRMEECERMFNPREGEMEGVLRKWEGVLETVVGMGVGGGTGSGGRKGAWEWERKEEVGDSVWFVEDGGRRLMGRIVVVGVGMAGMGVGVWLRRGREGRRGGKKKKKKKGREKREWGGGTEMEDSGG